MDDNTKAWLMRRAIQSSPHEACGFVMESGDIIEIRNVASNSMREFKMDRNQMIEKLSGREDFIYGIWHTHPSGSSSLSSTDIEAIYCGAIQWNWHYWIVTKSEVVEYPIDCYAPKPDSFWRSFT